MKKIICLIISLICLNTCSVAIAEEQDMGFIFKIQESEIAMFSMANEDIVPLGNGLYSTNDINAVYEALGQENILSVFPDYELELFEINDEAYAQQWYLKTIDYNFSYNEKITGEEVKIAIIDSGLNVEHPDLNQTKILQGYNCIADETATDVVDNYGHGTQVAGVIAAQVNNGIAIAGIAPNVSIIPIKITDGKTLKLSSFFLGLNKAIESDCDIINLSLGGKFSDADALAELKSYIDKAVEKGIIIVSAVGNYGTSDIYYPAGLDNVIGVGSVDSDLQVSSFSQMNESVYVSAPGRGIVTLSKENGIATASGTSIATPIVTAAVALVKEVRPLYSYEEVMQLLKETAVDTGELGYDTSYGYGILNIENLFTSIYEEIPVLEIENLEDVQEGTLTVSLDKGNEIYNGYVEIIYDDSVEIVDVTKGDIFIDILPDIKINDDENKISISWADAYLSTESGNMLNIDYKIKDGEYGAVNFTVAKHQMLDMTGNRIWIDCNSGGILMNIPFIKGDIYKDGIVNIKDVIRLNQYLAKWDVILSEGELANADIVEDSEINSKDLIKLNQYLANWDITLE